MDAGSFSAPSLGLHVDLVFREGRLASLRLVESPSFPADGWRSEDARVVAARVARHLETGREDLSDVPVDLAAVSGFHRTVLEALRAVPAGETVSYGELARRVGNPGASRAVGGAMARNPIPVVVPCHRVLATGGRLGNYSGARGVDTKRALLSLEGARLPQRA